MAYLAYKIRADRLKRYRRRNLLTQKQFAERAGLHAATIQRVEAGGGAGRDTLEKLCVILGCDPLELVR